MNKFEVQPIDPLVDESWDKAVKSQEDHVVFHRAAWARVLSDTYGHRPCYVRILVDGIESVLIPLMEVNSCITGRRGVSLPFSDFAGPIWVQKVQASVIYQVITDIAAERKWRHCDLRGGFFQSERPGANLTYQIHCLDLSQGVDQIQRGLDSSVRRAIRKAECSGIEVSVSQGLDAMEIYYDLHCRTRKRHGLPPQPFAFFKAIEKNLIGADLGDIALATLEGVPVAGAIFLRSAGRVIYKFGASDARYWSLRPNQALIWASIRHYSETGCGELNFGRTSRNDKGLSRFKKSWGCKSADLCYYRYVLRFQEWAKARHHPSESHHLIFGHTPITLNQIAGRLIYPHLD